MNRAFKAGQRYYLNDRYECVPIEQLELADEDLELIRRMGLHFAPSVPCP